MAGSSSGRTLSGPISDRSAQLLDNGASIEPGGVEQQRVQLGDVDHPVFAGSPGRSEKIRDSGLITDVQFPIG
nr:hypothetical protein [Nocardia xishanensis]